MTRQPPGGEELLSPAEVAALFGVKTTTVKHWAETGRLSTVLTLGGHRRYFAREVRALLEGGQPAKPGADA